MTSSITITARAPAPSPMGGGGGGSVFIPQPLLEIPKGPQRNPGITLNDITPTNSQLFAYWLPCDDEFLGYAPEYWIYRYSRGPRRLFSPQTRDTKKGWRHPNSTVTTVTATHVYNSAGVGVTTQTEFPFASVEPYARTPLNFNVFSFFKLVSGLYRPNNAGGNSAASPSRFARNNYFRVCIAINNPDAGSKWPKIFGPFSAVMAIGQVITGDSVVFPPLTPKLFWHHGESHSIQRRRLSI